MSKVVDLHANSAKVWDEVILDLVTKQPALGGDGKPLTIGIAAITALTAPTAKQAEAVVHARKWKLASQIAAGGHKVTAADITLIAEFAPQVFAATAIVGALNSALDPE